MKAKWKIRMGASKINDITRVFRSCSFWKKQVIFALNFTRIHCHYLLITKREKLLNFWLWSATVYRSRTLNLLGSFFYSCSSSATCFSSWFHFPSCLLILRYLLRRLYISKRDTIVKTIFYQQVRHYHKLLLGNLSINCERVIWLSSQAKLT